MIHIIIPSIDEMELIQLDTKVLPEKRGLYFLFDGLKTPIYIGISKNIKRRVITHCGTGNNTAIKNKPEIVYVSYLLFSEKIISLKGIERIYIDHYKPKYNDLPWPMEWMPTVEEQRWAMKDVPMR